MYGSGCSGLVVEYRTHNYFHFLPLSHPYLPVVLAFLFHPDSPLFHSWSYCIRLMSLFGSGCSGLVVKYRTRNRKVVGSTHTRSTASNLEQVANLLCGQANSASYPLTGWSTASGFDLAWFSSLSSKHFCVFGLNGAI